ncbi:amidase [Nonomuraea sp. NPDC050790]|uniref:amidase n=1 Tax=Nonomuraea sp. NPDC050790 TaxID=3364371 RepID=UPI0037BC0290
MEFHEYLEYDAVGLSALIRAGHVTAHEVETVARQALALANESLNALAAPLFPTALRHAAGAPFTGVPFLIKDAGPMAEGIGFHLGSRALGPGVPAGRDSDLMRRFRAAGLATLGLTTMPELGIAFTTEPVRTGPTRNPWNLAHSAGGSSGGAAALVAAGAVPAAHASDGAGSIRVPASCCGLVGLMPTRGRVGCEPMFGLSHDFVLTRTVRDAAHLLDALSGTVPGARFAPPAPARPYRSELRADPVRLRVAVTTEAARGTDPEVAAATDRAARTLEEQGHHVERDRPPADPEEIVTALVAPQIAFLTGVFAHAPRPPDPALLEAVSRRVFEEGAVLRALDLVAAFEAQERLCRMAGAFFGRYDLLLTPTLARPPVPLGVLRYDDPSYSVAGWVRELLEYGPFTALYNITGQPAISLPLGRDSAGLPIGVQAVAPYGREDLLIQVASLLTPPPAERYSPGLWPWARRKAR